MTDEILSYQSRGPRNLLKAIAIGPSIVTKELAYALYTAAYDKPPDNFDISLEVIECAGLLTNPRDKRYVKQFTIAHDKIRDCLRADQNLSSTKEKEIYLKAMETLPKDDVVGEELLLLYGERLKDDCFFNKMLCATKNESPLSYMIKIYLSHGKYDKVEFIVDCLLERKGNYDNEFYTGLENLKKQLVNVRVMKE